MTEFDLIRHIASAAERVAGSGMRGIGDDCAEYDLGNGESLLLTTDMLVERRHFRIEDFTPEELAYKSLAVNLSDIAAMGGRAEATLLSLAIPASIDESWRTRFVDEYTSESERRNVKLIGGDTCSSESGLAISVTAIGRCRNDLIRRRDAAREGDIIYVTGTLGSSAAGLDDILSGRGDTAFAHAHRHPRVYGDEGMWLSESRAVHAMMDVSDGIASDLRHIMERSHVGVRIDTELIPAATTVEQAACGGEDYVLLLTADRCLATELELQYQKRFGESLRRIGTVIPYAGKQIDWRRDGEPIYPSWMGYEHF